MTEKIVNMFVVVVIAAILWLPACYAQKLMNKVESKDYNVRARGLWTYLLGVRPDVEKIYLRLAYAQVLGLVYLVAGFLAVWLFDKEALLDVTAGLGIGMCCIVPIGIVELLAKRKS